MALLLMLLVINIWLFALVIAREMSVLLPWFALMAGLVIIAFWAANRALLVSQRRFLQRFREGLCTQCGYDKRGNPQGICPECGTP